MKKKNQPTKLQPNKKKNKLTKWISVIFHSKSWFWSPTGKALHAVDSSHLMGCWGGRRVRSIVEREIRQHENYLMLLCCKRKHSKGPYWSFDSQPTCSFFFFSLIKCEFTRLLKAKISEGLQMAREKTKIREAGNNQRKAPDSHF